MKKLLAVVVMGVVLVMIMMIYSWQHHMFVTGLNRLVTLVFAYLFLIIAVLLMTLGVRWVRKRWVKDARYMPAVLFAAGGLSWCIGSLFRGVSTWDLQLQDTFYVISYDLIVKWVLVFLVLISGIYLLFSKAFANGWLNTMSYVHFWVTITGCYFLFWPKPYEGLAGMPRRYFDYGNSFGNFVSFNWAIEWVAIITVMMQVVFVGMIGYSLLRKRSFTR